LKQSLLAKYPLGYALFAVGEKTIYVPDDLSFERDYVIDWTGSKLSKLEPDWVEFYPPNITNKQTGSALLGDFYFRLKRKGRELRPYPGFSHQIKMFLEIIEDKDSFVVVVLGFKE
jgi:hypothetical protein